MAPRHPELDVAVRDLWPLSRTYEYVAELGLAWRLGNGTDWLSFCEEVDLGIFPAPQAQGLRFWEWLENHERQRVRSLAPYLIENSPDHMQVELEASLACMRQNIESGMELYPPDRIQPLDGEPVQLICARNLSESRIDAWTATALQGARVHHQQCRRIACSADIKRAHDDYYVESIKAQAARGLRVMLTPETEVSESSWKQCVHGSGAMMEGVDIALAGAEEGPVFCQVRPGSHHACIARAGGTCLINNIAVAAKYATGRRDVRRVGVLDIDAHHGNGTEEIFYESAQVVTASVHQDAPFFPGTGRPSAKGRGRGAGSNLNVAVSPRHDWGSAVLEALQWLLASRPHIILVELSTDAHMYDGVSGLPASDADYAMLGSELGRCGLPVVAELGASTSERAWVGGISAFVRGFAEGRGRSKTL